MASKSTFPAGTGPDDYRCFGPPATEDTKFSGTCIADMGCFQQEAVDSNKYFHCAKVQNKKTGGWGVYTEWGRVGAKNPQFMFVECNSEAEAQKTYEAKCAEKNTKRGNWVSIAGRQMFRPIEKKGKPEDLYVVRNLAKRDVGLPDAKTITSPDHASDQATKVAKSTTKKALRCDLKTTQLMRDLLGGAVTYTRTSLVGDAIPVQKSITDGRDILDLAMKRIAVVGNKLQDQINDKDLKQLTYALYGMIPKIKPVGAAEDTWILSQNNILMWQQDLDAFETAIKADTGVMEIEGDDPMEGFPLDMEWIDPKTELGAWLYRWWPTAATRNHSYGPLKIKNLWKIDRYGDRAVFDKDQKRILSELGPNGYTGEHRPLHQDKERFDLSSEERVLWQKSNSALLFHGSSTVNIPGILRENLRLPHTLTGVVITGAAFGSGIYMADSYAKSAGYTSLYNSYWSRGRGSVKGRDAFMLACENVVGNPHLAPHSYGYKGYPKGHHTIFGKGGVTSGIVNNEWIFFDRKPLLRYLMEFTC